MIFIRNTVLLTACLLWGIIGQAQSVGIGTDTPDNGAILDVVSTDKGLLIPRVDTSNVSAPELGMMVLFVGTSDLYKYNGSNWEAVGNFSGLITDDDLDTKVYLGEHASDDSIKMMVNGLDKFYFRSNDIGRSRIEFPNNNFNSAIGSHALGNNTSGSHNVSMGVNSLSDNTGGQFNVGIGNFALDANTSGSQNTGVGYLSLNKNTTGLNNVGVGISALKSNRDGNFNVAMGAASNENNTSGSGNVSLGTFVHATNTTGNNNVAVGREALRLSLTGSGNVALGAFAGYNETGSNRLYIENSVANKNNALIYGEFDNDFLRLNGEVHLRDGMVDADKDSKIYFSEADGDQVIMNLSGEDKFNFKSMGLGSSRIEFRNNDGNIAVGIDALYNNIDDNNLAIGNQALYNNNDGNFNLGIGNNALYFNTKGRQNVAIGHNAIFSNILGLNNIGIGISALQSCYDGSYNVAIGTSANSMNTIGSGNTIIGNFASANNTTGSNNVVVGRDAMSNNQGGSGNVMLGFLAGSSEMGSNKLYIENSTAGSLSALIYGEFDNDLIRLNGEVIIRDGIKGNTEINGNTEISGNIDVGSDATIDGFLAIGDIYQDKARLEVSGTGSQNHTLTAAYYNAAGNSGIITQGRPLSGWFEQHVAAKEFQAFSDARIKNIKSLSDSEEDLYTLSKIEVTDYKFIDSIGSGNQLHKKVIAQQVKEIYPQAVQATIRDFIPNVYQLTDIKNGWISIPVEVEIGDRIKLILKDGDMIVQVVESTEQGIRLDIDQEGEVFVYGTEVDDFHTVDYEALSMLNISATQELIKQIELLKEDRDHLKASLEAQNDKIDGIMKHLGLSEKEDIQ